MKIIESGSMKIVVQWSEFNGRLGMDIRKFYQDKETGEMKPTKKGIWIGEDQVGEVFTAFQDLLMEEVHHG